MLGYLLLGLAAVLLLVWATLQFGRPRRLSGIPPGEVVYSGVDGHSRVLRAPKYHLLGRPDYVVKRGAEFIPVEVKSGTTPKRPFDSDRMQVTAQALLVEAEFGRRPSQAFVCYPAKTFQVKIRPQTVSRLQDAVQLMLDARARGSEPDAYPAWYYCPTCSRAGCPKRVTKKR